MFRLYYANCCTGGNYVGGRPYGWNGRQYGGLGGPNRCAVSVHPTSMHCMHATSLCLSTGIYITHWVWTSSHLDCLGCLVGLKHGSFSSHIICGAFKSDRPCLSCCFLFCRRWNYGRRMLAQRSILTADKAQAADKQQAADQQRWNQRPPSGGYGPYGGSSGSSSWGGGGGAPSSSRGGNSGSSAWQNAAWGGR
jgi:hypothetical protein